MESDALRSAGDEGSPTILRLHLITNHLRTYRLQRMEATEHGGRLVYRVLSEWGRMPREGM